MCGSENGQSLTIRITFLIGSLLGSSWVCLCMSDVVNIVFFPASMSSQAIEVRVKKNKRTANIWSMFCYIPMFLVSSSCV